MRFTYLVFKWLMWAAASVALIWLVSVLMRAVVCLIGIPNRDLTLGWYAFMTPFAMMTLASVFWEGGAK